MFHASVFTLSETVFPNILASDPQKNTFSKQGKQGHDDKTSFLQNHFTNLLIYVYEFCSLEQLGPGMCFKISFLNSVITSQDLQFVGLWLKVGS